MASNVHASVSYATYNAQGFSSRQALLTNLAEAQKIKDPNYRERMAQAIAHGVFEYQKALNYARKKSAA